MLITLLLLGVCGPLLWLARPNRNHRYAWLAALPSAVVALWQLWQLPAIAHGAVLSEVYPWAPQLGLALALRLDGLSLFFGLIITGIGAAIAFYTNYYLEQEPRQGFFYLLLFLFMTCMLGLVWSDDLLTLFVFWEGTSITSYLLIGFKSSYKEAVDGARRALIVTTLGGLAMLAGMILLGQAAGTFRISAILAQPAWPSSPVYPWALALILLGAFTKSAQFPFHFWLPGAMAAPTPASAYLHSATMVKAGIYLLARLQVGLGDSPLWFWALFLAGGASMLLGAVVALRYRDMKALLAYATISQLGVAVFLLALPGPAGAIAVVVVILAHALYKAPLFMTAGIVDHATGSRDLRRLAALGRPMPLVAAVAVAAGLSMAGVPPMLGYLAKELLLDDFLHTATHGQPLIGWLGYAAAVIMAVFSVAAITALVWEAFLRPQPDEPPAKTVHHQPSAWFAAPALVLAALGLLLPLAMPVLEAVVTPAAAAISGAPIHVELALWHGFTPVFLTTLAVLALGFAVFWLRRPLRRWLDLAPAQLSGVRIYDAVVDSVYHFAYTLTTRIQGRRLGFQIGATFVAAVAVLIYALFHLRPVQPAQVEWFDLPTIPEVIIFVVGIFAALATVRARSRLSAIIALGVVGVAVTLVFVFFSAPDLALTQLLIEVLTVVLLVLVFYRVKPDRRVPEAKGIPYLRMAVAIAMGAFGFIIVIINHTVQVAPSISPYFLNNAQALGQGSNVVNVILVDFRGYDTLGEITVLTLAALGGYAVLRSPQLHILRRRLNTQRSRPQTKPAANTGDNAAPPGLTPAQGAGDD